MEAFVIPVRTHCRPRARRKADTLCFGAVCMSAVYTRETLGRDSYNAILFGNNLTNVFSVHGKWRRLRMPLQQKTWAFFSPRCGATWLGAAPCWPLACRHSRCSIQIALRSNNIVFAWFFTARAKHATLPASHDPCSSFTETCLLALATMQHGMFVYHYLMSCGRICLMCRLSSTTNGFDLQRSCCTCSLPCTVCGSSGAPIHLLFKVLQN